MELKAGYKKSEVGVIPEDWDAPCLGDNATKVGSGITPTGGEKVYKQEGRPFLRSQNVGWGTLLMEDIAFIDDETHETFKATEIEADDVFLNITGASIGRSAVADPRVARGNVNQHVCIIRSNREQLHPRFLNYYLLSNAGQRQIDSFQAEGNRQGLNFGQIRAFRLPLPPILEQRAIAKALGDVDALIGALEKLIAKKRDLKQAAMQQLLNGKTRLPAFVRTNNKTNLTEMGEIPADWKTDRVGHLARITTGGRNTQDRIADGSYPFFVRSSNVERINSYSFDGEAVLTAGDGVGTGKVFHYIRGRFDFHQRVYKISDFSERLDGQFFFLFFSSHFYERIMSMTAKSSVDSVRMDMIADMIVPLPSMAEQRAIAALLSDIDAEIAALEQRRDKTRALKLGMIQELLTGRTRLV